MVVVVVLLISFLGCLAPWGLWLGLREGYRDGYSDGYNDRDMETIFHEEPGTRRHDTY